MNGSIIINFRSRRILGHAVQVQRQEGLDNEADALEFGGQQELPAATSNKAHLRNLRHLVNLPREELKEELCATPAKGAANIHPFKTPGRAANHP